MNSLEFKEPINITWSDILIGFKVQEIREYDAMQAGGIRHAISRRLKFTHPKMSFETSIEGNKIRVQRID